MIAAERTGTDPTRPTGADRALRAAALVPLIAVAACSAGTTAPTERHAARSTSVATTPASTDPRRASPVVETNGDVISAAGAILPNPVRTPGATNPAVIQANIDRTICVPGWTSTIRPASSYTTALKVRQLASGYAYRSDQATRDYEEDHLISLELGGSPTAEANLWPEPYRSAEGARTKDRIENALHRLVCSHRLSLVAAQHAIASDWAAAYDRYVGPPPTSAVRR